MKEYYIIVGIHEEENTPVVSNIFTKLIDAEKYLEKYPSCDRNIYTRYKAEINTSKVFSTRINTDDSDETIKKKLKKQKQKINDFLNEYK